MIQLQMLLHGQQNIDSRLDSLQKEQQKNRQELEDGLMGIMRELKHDIAGKSMEHSEDLDKLKQRQERLYNEFNVLFLRLDEMEHLVSNLLHETKDDAAAERVQQQKPAEIQEIAKSESLQSVLSISSGSCVEGPSSQEKRYRKPSQAFLYSQKVEEAQAAAAAKGQASEVIHL
ncbi:hypothetical protein OESDEN_16620 [Oesophagostomum dentatum]|uniref:Uncharacterized protein n=1 Tax=Oesophagostomum dentatum TaxID=61180 RepID=A0A0B1SFJ4_OESDE|nr:hypothetical protein OESDEN_16620 [Oesophagostomum dentatum]